MTSRSGTARTAPPRSRGRLRPASTDCRTSCSTRRGRSCNGCGPASRTGSPGPQARRPSSSSCSTTAPGWRTTPLCPGAVVERSEEHTSELQSRVDLVCRLLLEKKKKKKDRKKKKETNKKDLQPKSGNKQMKV